MDMAISKDFSRVVVSGSQLFRVYTWDGSQYIISYEYAYDASSLDDFSSVSLSEDNQYIIVSGIMQGFTPFTYIMAYSSNIDSYLKVR